MATKKRKKRAGLYSRPDRLTPGAAVGDLPGSAGKIEEMRRRVQLGLPLFERGDVESDPARVSEYRRAGNGTDVNTGADAPVRPDPGEKVVHARDKGRDHLDTGRDAVWALAPARGAGERLRLLREGRGYGLRQLARRCGTDHATLARVEAGAPANLQVLWALADVYGLSLDELVGRVR